MTDNKIAVIIHMTDEAACERAINSVTNIILPSEYMLDILPVSGANKYRAYNFAMKNSDAKYKFYIDENVEIRQKNIFANIIKIFQSDKNIGVIGCSGAIQLSTHGSCIKSAKRCGKIYIGEEMREFAFEDIDGDYREVDSVDGWFIATQYDTDWGIGNTAQCIEFKRQGYKSVVVKQNKPYIHFNADNFAEDENERRAFLENYSADIFPLVSILIPTFNRPKFFELALLSALSQTYRNFEIVVSDNSSNDDTANLIQPYLKKYSCIKYFRQHNFDANDNWNFLRQYNNPAAEYVNYLMDDDIFYPRKLELMVEAYRNNPDVSLVTSLRHVINELGEIKGVAESPFNQSGKISGNYAGKKMFLTFENFIGEPTTVLICKKFLRDNDLCWNNDETGFFNLIDISTWLQLLSKGNMYLIAEPLSAYRDHEGIASGWVYAPALCAINWVKLIKSAWERKMFLTTEWDIRLSLSRWFKFQASRGLEYALGKNYRGVEIITLEKTIAAVAETLGNGYKFNLPKTEYSEQDEYKKMR